MMPQNALDSDVRSINTCIGPDVASWQCAPKARMRIPTIPARDSNLKAATIPIEGGQYWPVGTFMGSQRW